MRISVIIPALNAAPFIERTLQSVAAQTFPAHETLVIDDGSTDETIERTLNSGVPARVLKTNRALPAGARLAGIRAATGDWVAYLDADDYWYPHHLQSARDTLAGTNDVAYMAHLHCMYHATEEPFDVGTGPFLPQLCAGLSSNLFLEIFSLTWYFSPSGVVQRRDVVLDVGGPDTNPLLRGREDIELFMRVIAGRTWSYNPQPGWCYRLGTPGNVSSNRMRCEHGMFLALLKNELSYPGTSMARAIRHSARRVMAMAAVDGTAEDLERTWDLAWPRLPFMAQLFFLGWRIRPDLFRRIIRLKRQVQGVG